MLQRSLMRRCLLFIICALSVCYSEGQTPTNLDPCREKGRAPLAARGENLDYFQFPSLSKYDVKYLKLDINIETNNRSISGSALLEAKAVASLDSFTVELRDNIIVDSVFFNNVKVSFQHFLDHVIIKPAIPLPTGSSIQALYYYHGVASNAGVFAGFSPGNGLSYTASLSESYQAREWFPAKQVLSDKIDSADIWITTSAVNKAGSNGLLQAVVDMPGNKKQYQWKTRYPMAYYHPSFAVGNYMDYSIYAKPAAMAPDSILVQNYIVDNPAFLNQFKGAIDRTPTYIEKMSELFGLYPFNKEKYGHAMAAIGGGMEHQTMSTMEGFSASLISHELAHQWWGNNVTCATWNHIWLNEGFASYAEYLMVENVPQAFTTTPAAYMQSVHNDVLASPNGSVYVPDISIFDENRIFNSRFSYNKGSAIIHTLRFELQSDAVFFQALRNYQQQFKDSVATADDFRRVVETTSGKNLVDFFNQWYYGEGYPTFNVNYSKQGDSIVLFVNQTVSAPAVTPFFKGLYEIKIGTNQGDTTVKIQLNANNSFFKFRSDRVPNSVTVDPNNWVLNKTGSITTPVIDPVTNSGEVILFPNPTSNSFTVSYQANQFESLLLYDMGGRMLRKENIARSSTLKTLSIDLPAGIYFLRLQGKKGSVVKKLLVD